MREGSQSPVTHGTHGPCQLLVMSSNIVVVYVKEWKEEEGFLESPSEEMACVCSRTCTACQKRSSVHSVSVLVL